MMNKKHLKNQRWKSKYLEPSSRISSLMTRMSLEDCPKEASKNKQTISLDCNSNKAKSMNRKKINRRIKKKLRSRLTAKRLRSSLIEEYTTWILSNLSCARQMILTTDMPAISMTTLKRVKILPLKVFQRPINQMLMTKMSCRPEK